MAVSVEGADDSMVAGPGLSSMVEGLALVSGSSVAGGSVGVVLGVVDPVLVTLSVDGGSVGVTSAIDRCLT